MQKATVKNQLNKPTKSSTLRWILQSQCLGRVPRVEATGVCFQGIHIMIIQGVQRILNLIEEYYGSANSPACASPFPKRSERIKQKINSIFIKKVNKRNIKLISPKHCIIRGFLIGKLTKFQLVKVAKFHHIFLLSFAMLLLALLDILRVYPIVKICLKQVLVAHLKIGLHRL